MRELEVATRLASEFRCRELNEADTRHQIIDELIGGVIGWPKALRKLELYNLEGFADYVLLRPDGVPFLVIEAKREGAYFSVPETSCAAGSSAHISIKALITDDAIAAAVKQAKSYAIDIGAPFCCVTNGHEWIFFKVFEVGGSWQASKAFVVNGLDYFVRNFTEAINNFSYSQIVKKGALNALLSPGVGPRRESYSPKENIGAFSVSISANHYSPQLRPIADKFFGVIEVGDDEFMDFCYVSDKDYERAFNAARGVLSDSLTPYLEQYRIRDIKNDEGGGELGNRVEKSIISRKRKDVVVLFGGKGVGKSTFLRRLLFHKPPQIIKKNAVVSLVDMLNVPVQQEIIHKEIWQRVAKHLDKDGILSESRDRLLHLFKDKYQLSLRQQLYGLPENSLEFNARLNDLVNGWLEDKKYCAKALAEYYASQHKGVVVVIDNTDQFGTELQDFCFTTAHEIASELGCLVIISMREERFYSSTIHGVLDAFQNSGFHLSAPLASHVFLRRIQYVVRLLKNEEFCNSSFGLNSSDPIILRLIRLFRTFEHDFRVDGSHLGEFLTACAHGNIRLALELFRGILQSRYTNVNEITSASDGFWTFQMHQVLKPIMIPYRFFYDEGQSHVPNIFQARSAKNGSHFTALRILAVLAESLDGGLDGYISLNVLGATFSDRFNMDEDFRLNVDVLLRYGLIESNNRLDEYTAEVDKVRLTSYGLYTTRELYKSFSYLELVSTDTRIFDKRVSDELSVLASDEYVLWEQSFIDQTRRLDRVRKRLEKASEFIAYLEQEEAKERALYGLTDVEVFSPGIKASFAEESIRVRRSARRQKY